MFKILVGIFVFNEGEKFRILLGDLACNCLDYGILLLDGGSSDGAAALCAGSSVRVLHNDCNMRVDYSIRQFLDEARAGGYEAVVIMSCDSKIPPSGLPAFLEKLDAG